MLKIYLLYRVNSPKPLSGGQNYSEAYGADFAQPLGKPSDFKAWVTRYYKEVEITTVYEEERYTTFAVDHSYFGEPQRDFYRLVTYPVWEPKS